MYHDASTSHCQEETTVGRGKIMDRWGNAGQRWEMIGMRCAKSEKWLELNREEEEEEEEEVSRLMRVKMWYDLNEGVCGGDDDGDDDDDDVGKSDWYEMLWIMNGVNECDGIEEIRKDGCDG